MIHWGVQTVFINGAASTDSKKLKQQQSLRKQSASSSYFHRVEKINFAFSQNKNNSIASNCTIVRISGYVFSWKKQKKSHAAACNQKCQGLKTR